MSAIWYNPVKGHAQYSLRDPRRDRKSGRIWRIVPKGVTLQDPPQFAGASIPALIEILKRPEYRYRHWAKRELRERNSDEVKRALDRWVAALDKSDPRLGIIKSKRFGLIGMSSGQIRIY